MKKYFITATGTEIGKTAVTCSLIRGLRKKGKRVCAIKPVISGWENGNDKMDTVHILKSLDMPVTPENIDKISPWRFAAPLSPDIAAARENKSIDFQKLADYCMKAGGDAEYFFIEGIGGAMVPLTAKETVLDLIKALDTTAIIVAGSYLGSISHTLTTLKAIENEGVKVERLIVNESENSVGIKDTIKTLKNFVRAPIMEIPRMENICELEVDLTLLHK